MTETTHNEPNYMGVFWWLLVLTLLELGVIYMPIHRMANSGPSRGLGDIQSGTGGALLHAS